MFDIKSFYEASSVEDAVRALSADPDSEVISGGTDVLIRVREGKDAGKGLVSIHNIPELKGIEMEENGTILIRPATSFSHITNDPIIKKHLNMLGRRWTRWEAPRCETPPPSAEISATEPPPLIPPPPCAPSTRC